MGRPVDPVVLYNVGQQGPEASLVPAGNDLGEEVCLNYSHLYLSADHTWPSLQSTVFTYTHFLGDTVLVSVSSLATSIEETFQAELRTSHEAIGLLCRPKKIWWVS